MPQAALLLQVNKCSVGVQAWSLLIAGLRLLPFADAVEPMLRRIIEGG